jgi:hypothetical protein
LVVAGEELQACARHRVHLPAPHELPLLPQHPPVTLPRYHDHDHDPTDIVIVIMKTILIGELGTTSQLHMCRRSLSMRRVGAEAS